ncbi:MAG: flagellar hook-associated protein 1 FlgK, partial [Shewanella sp.]
MAMDLLNIARTGVLSAQSQLAVTSNNITNANT